ncbi:MAG: hypothetical protein U0T82_00900 [Bacteroidales bacterium]
MDQESLITLCKKLFSRKKPVILALLSVLLLAVMDDAAGQSGGTESFRVDSIRIRKNWRTRELIVLRELKIEPGQMVTHKDIEKAVTRIWNIGNFARVNYRIDTLPDQRLLLNITALDAFTIVPNISFNGNRKEYLLTAGIIDNNLFGRNISLDAGFSTGTTTRRMNFNLGIPRQLLYRNMILRGGFQYGNILRYRYDNGDCIAGTGYLQKNAYLSVGNPWHTDDHYTFSPDLGISVFSQRADSSLVPDGIPVLGNPMVSFLAVNISESAGIVNRIRHQQEGSILSVGLGYGFGLNHRSPGYAGVGISGFIAKLLNRIIQLSAGFNTGYTSARSEGLLFYLGPDQVKGILSGERWGRAYYSLATSLHLTYLNRDWLAMEQSFFWNAGQADNHYLELFERKPLYSVGSKLRLMVPMVPWLGINFYYAWRGSDKHWYSMEF